MKLKLRLLAPIIALGLMVAIAPQAGHSEISTSNREFLKELKLKLNDKNPGDKALQSIESDASKAGTYKKYYKKNEAVKKAVRTEAQIINAVSVPKQTPAVKNHETALSAIKETPLVENAVQTGILQPVDLSANVIKTDECFDVVLDPGHGGRYEPTRNNSGDHWDPFSKTFLLPYNFGASSNGMYEHEWTLNTAKRIEEILQLTQTDAGFAEFCKIIQKYADISNNKIKRVRINTYLTRKYSWEDDPEKNTSNVNKKYRLFDSPDSFSSNGKIPSDKVYPGRISYINQLSPDIVICLHNNSSPEHNARGYSSVIVPHFDFFSGVNNIINTGAKFSSPGKVKVSAPQYSQITGFISSIISRSEKIDAKTIVSDTATYFTGFRAFTNKFIGLRYLMVTWRYNTSSIFTSFMLFFMRENSIYESYRRSGGPEGYGGDNFYSSEELIRFIRYALWKDISTENRALASKSSPDELLGKHCAPFVSDWAIPLHVNAITAFIEIGYLSNVKDRNVLKEKQTVMAESIAVGIYSLLSGLKPYKLDGIEPPKGKAIDFSKYGRDKNSNGYFNISCKPVTF